MHLDINKLKELEDLTNQQTIEFAKYKFSVTLIPKHLMGNQYKLQKLNWQSIRYNDEEEIEKIPNDKKGVYAFAVCHENSILPPHGYILYIGMVGKNSGRCLRDRYKDYLNINTVKKRDNIAQMIGNWSKVLRFFYAPIAEISSDDLEALEKQLNSALIPPYALKDMDAKVKKMRTAFP